MGFIQRQLNPNATFISGTISSGKGRYGNVVAEEIGSATRYADYVLRQKHGEIITFVRGQKDTQEHFSAWNDGPMNTSLHAIVGNWEEAGRIAKELDRFAQEYWSIN